MQICRFWIWHWRRSGPWPPERSSHAAIQNLHMGPTKRTGALDATRFLKFSPINRRTSFKRLGLETEADFEADTKCGIACEGRARHIGCTCFRACIA